MAISNQSIRLALDIRYAECKMATDGNPQDKFQRYKEDHPGTKKQPTDPLFQSKQIGETGNGMPINNHFHNENSQEHYPFWSASDHKDAAHTHSNHAHDLAIEKGLGQTDHYNKHVQESGGDEAHHEAQAKLHMDAHHEKKKQNVDHEDMRQFMNLKENPRPVGTTQKGKRVFSVGNHPLHKDFDWEDHRDAAKGHYQQSEAAEAKGHHNVANYHDMQASHHMNEIQKKAPNNLVVHPSMFKQKSQPQEVKPHDFDHQETKQILDQLDKTRDIEPEEQAPFTQKASSRLALRYLLT